MRFRVDLVGERQLIARIERLPRRLKREVKRIVQKVAIVDIESGAKRKLTQDGHIDSGALRSSIHSEFNTGRRILSGSIKELEAIIGTNLSYANRIEYDFDSYVLYAFNQAKPVFIRELENAIRGLRL